MIVVEGVEQQEDRIGVPQFGITAVLGDDDIFGLGIETDDAEVEVVVVVPDADLGFFRRGPSLVGVLLGETGRGLNELPQRLVDQSVELGRLGESESTNAPGLGSTFLGHSRDAKAGRQQAGD